MIPITQWHSQNHEVKEWIKQQRHAMFLELKYQPTSQTLLMLNQRQTLERLNAKNAHQDCYMRFGIVMLRNKQTLTLKVDDDTDVLEQFSRRPLRPYHGRVMPYEFSLAVWLNPYSVNAAHMCYIAHMCCEDFL